MKIHLNILLALSILLPISSSCVRERTDVSGNFLSDSTVRLICEGRETFVYSEEKCQLQCNLQHRIFIAHTDNMSDYFSVTFKSEWPYEEGDVYEADIKWTTVSDLKTKKDIAFELVKSEGDKRWLFDSHNNISAVIRILQ